MKSREVWRHYILCMLLVVLTIFIININYKVDYLLEVQKSDNEKGAKIHSEETNGTTLSNANTETTAYTNVVSEALKQRLDELKQSKKKDTKENREDDFSDVGSQSEVVKNDSCYVKSGNFSKPMFAYDKDCNKLPKDKAERKIALALKKLPDEMLITLKAEEEKDVLYVVTDYTCPYCRKLDSKLKEFNEAGYTLKYIFYPRAIDYGRDYADKARTVVTNMTNAFCAKDQAAAVEYLYDHKEAPFADCADVEGRINAPIREDYILAHLLNVKYTPAVFSSDGKLSYGFRSVSTTLRNLGLK